MGNVFGGLFPKLSVKMVNSISGLRQLLEGVHFAECSVVIEFPSCLLDVEQG